MRGPDRTLLNREGTLPSKRRVTGVRRAPQSWFLAGATRDERKFPFAVFAVDVIGYSVNDKTQRWGRRGGTRRRTG
jgi:hypothetical protein